MWPLKMDSQLTSHDNKLFIFLFSIFVFAYAVGNTVLPVLSSFLFAIPLYTLRTLQAMGGHLS